VPTPFTHLASAQRLLVDDKLPAAVRAAIERDLPAFLLGNIAADARIAGGVAREATHFFAYDRPIVQHPWRVMLAQHPSLSSPHSSAQRAFLAGYVAHLSLDELWSLEMVRPRFGNGTWGDRHQRFLMLHVILIYMDMRDYAMLENWQRKTLCMAAPNGWTPFLSDPALADWRDFIGGQLAPEGSSQTLQVFGERINVSPETLGSILADPQRIQQELWDHVPYRFLLGVESHMYDHARTQLSAFYAET
jgi:hypothetical protein